MAQYGMDDAQLAYDRDSRNPGDPLVLIDEAFAQALRQIASEG